MPKNIWPPGRSPPAPSTANGRPGTRPPLRPPLRPPVKAPELPSERPPAQVVVTFSTENIEPVQEPSKRDESRRGSANNGRSFTVEEVEEIRNNYEQQLAEKEEDHFAEMEQARQDFAIVIASVKAGNTSETILELTSKIKDLEQELEECKADFQLTIEDLTIKLKRAESANFFGLRRNEEMGSKIYQMQNDMEEMDRKHKIELEAYRESLDDSSNAKHLNDLILQNQELENRKSELETELESVRKKQIDEMEMYTIKLQEEKRTSIEEMTDKVLKLESLIEEIKTEHKAAIKLFEKQARDEKYEAVQKEKDKVGELETRIEDIKRDYEIEIDELSVEHKKEVEKLRKFYEKEKLRQEAAEPKRRAMSDGEGLKSKGNSDKEVNVVKEKHAAEIKQLKDSFAVERQKLEESLQNQINDIRTQYDEKLKCSVKEGMRRQSISDRKSDGTRMRELVASNESLKTKLLESECKYEEDVKNYKQTIKELEKIIAELQGSGHTPGSDSTVNVSSNISEEKSELAAEKRESQRKLKEISDQMERYQRRIEYYREKAEREGREESHRVEELQAEIVQLEKEKKSLEDSEKKEAWRVDLPIQRPTRASLDRGTPRRYTDSFDVERQSRLRDSRKRWSNLEERSEVIAREIGMLQGKRNPRLSTTVKKDEVGKSGSVLARKALWENISTDEPVVKTATPKTSITRTVSSIK